MTALLLLPWSMLDSTVISFTVNTSLELPMEQTRKFLTKHFLVGICQFRQIGMFCSDTGIFLDARHPGNCSGAGTPAVKGAAALEQVSEEKPSRATPLAWLRRSQCSQDQCSGEA